MKRIDDFENRRKHIKNLSDDELYNRFWELTEKIASPLVDLAKQNTTPAIERSVVLRMGFSSLEADKLIKEAIKWNLLSKGVGHCILVYSELKNLEYLKAGEDLVKGIGWKEVKDYFNNKINKKN